jgi:hypothetical protein
MGQDQSRDLGVPQTANTISSWMPSEVDGFICKVKRDDGSTVKELFVPQWGISFFKAHGTLGIRENNVGAAGAVFIRVDVDSAVKLYAAFYNDKMAKAAFASGVSAFDKYVNTLFKF